MTISQDRLYFEATQRQSWDARLKKERKRYAQLFLQIEKYDIMTKGIELEMLKGQLEIARTTIEACRNRIKELDYAHNYSKRPIQGKATN